MTDTVDTVDVVPAPERGRHYDWPLIRQEYVEGIELDGRARWLSLDDVARRNAARPDYVRRRAAEENWTDERAAFQRRIEQQRQEERSNELASLGADLDVSALRLARSGMAITAARLQELGAQATRRAQAIAAQDMNETSTVLPPQPSSDEVRVLARAAADWYALGAKAIGDTVTMQHIVGSAPGRPIELHVDADIDARDLRTEGILAILAEAGVLGDNGDHVIVGPRDRLALAAPGGATLDAGDGDDAEDEPVYPGEPGDDAEP